MVKGAGMKPTEIPWVNPVGVANSESNRGTNSESNRAPKNSHEGFGRHRKCQFHVNLKIYTKTVLKSLKSYKTSKQQRREITTIFKMSLIENNGGPSKYPLKDDSPLHVDPPGEKKKLVFPM